MVAATPEVGIFTDSRASPPFTSPRNGCASLVAFKASATRGASRCSASSTPYGSESRYERSGSSKGSNRLRTGTTTAIVRFMRLPLLRGTILLLATSLFAACGSGDEGGTAQNGGGSGGVSGGSGGATGGNGGTSGAPGGGAGDSGTDAGCSPATCTAPGYACVGGACVADCRPATANPCAAPTVCDVGSEHPGECVAPGSGCVITSAPVTCAAGDAGTSVTCGPGTECDGQGVCFPTLPCASMQCDGGTCWGTNCPCTRPPPTCTPAPLGNPGDPGTLNDPKFVQCGSLSSCDGGIFDLDFDQKCNAWGVTMLSGPDFLRKLDTSGAVTETTGVTNLNMGEVAAIQGESGVFGGGLSDVALTYTCCATCGCVLTGSNGNPQGVATLDAANGTLPMKIPSTKYSAGSGPFGNAIVDTGPYGLSWGLDRVLYVGNVLNNGDYHALDLTTQTSQIVATLSARVLASAPFDKAHMLVALEGGEVMLVPSLGAPGAPKSLVTLTTHATSLVRDAWSGRVYAELSDKSIVSFAADGSDVQPFQTAPGVGRITIAPDGYLYHLTVGFLSTPAVVRWPLPTTL